MRRKFPNNPWWGLLLLSTAVGLFFGSAVLSLFTPVKEVDRGVAEPQEGPTKSEINFVVDIDRAEFLSRDYYLPDE